ncbi:MAG: hypothetical protein IJU44_09840 [Kiritimatiellae bacterium]|jgi:hypothetical protein|nr:hypothetical protein [Kiritimatiellia bacterium]
MAKKQLSAFVFDFSFMGAFKNCVTVAERLDNAQTANGKLSAAGLL